MKNYVCMNFLELVTSRKSVRQYLQKDVESDKLDYILECARLAPSAANFQSWYFFVVRSEQVKTILQNCYPKKWFISNPAPVYIVACGDTNLSWKRSYDNKDHSIVDVSIAVEHICLAATEQGLGSCWICDFDSNRLGEELALPSHLYPVAIIPIGYPATREAHIPSRKPIEEISKTI